jgi:hypothetical protein
MELAREGITKNLNGIEMGINIPEFVQKKLSFATVDY